MAVVRLGRIIKTDSATADYRQCEAEGEIVTAAARLELSSIRDILKQDLYYRRTTHYVGWDRLQNYCASHYRSGNLSSRQGSFCTLQAISSRKLQAICAGGEASVLSSLWRADDGCQDTRRGKGYCYYCCSGVFNGTSAPGCAGYVSLAKADEEIGGKVWEAISDPEKLEAKINARVVELQADRADAQGDCVGAG